MSIANITIGKDSIVRANGPWEYWWINGPGQKAIGFVSKRRAIEYYCKNRCNPTYNKTHYDCECCPIKEGK